jgi:hypothetical protein
VLGVWEEDFVKFMENLGVQTHSFFGSRRNSNYTDSVGFRRSAMKSAQLERPKASRRKRKAILDPRSPTFTRDFIIAAKDFTRRATRSPEAALAVLVKEGILTPSGRLSKNYRA